MDSGELVARLKDLNFIRTAFQYFNKKTVINALAYDHTCPTVNKEY